MRRFVCFFLVLLSATAIFAQQVSPPKQHVPFSVTSGRAFAGTSNSGASSVQLRSYSGTIRVKKQ